jgi:mono/diheme cytochrome c family protein
MNHRDTKAQSARSKILIRTLCASVSLWFLSCSFALAQNLQDVLKQGEEVFNQSCTGYCHATKGGGGGAPRLAARGWDQTYINNIVTRGRDLFYDATRSFGRCSTCHEVNGLGIPVAAPIAQMPDNVQALRTLATPLVSTVVMNGESMPALVISKGTRSVIFYDLTTTPPVLVTAEPSSVKLSDGSSWRHASVIRSYRDAELESILDFLRSEK